MKRAIVAIVLAATLVSTGCMGSFSLTQKLYSWNEKATGNKFINNGIFWVLGYIVPVYGATLFIDVVILNLIEFWTGSNPVAFTGTDDVEKVVSSKGNTYKVTMGNSRVTVHQLSGSDAGKSVTVSYDKATRSYYLNDQKNGCVRVGTIDGNVLSLYSPDGTVTERLLDAPAEVAVAR